MILKGFFLPNGGWKGKYLSKTLSKVSECGIS